MKRIFERKQNCCAVSNGFGITKNKFQIQVYDFLAHGVFSDYDGLLGMDFWQGYKFCINTEQKTISINEGL